ncbi:hypothetical protein IE53DRAFT_386254 [Violaceomyces palustris]|uniref:Uncharacterized protein n=1 Tax=Violaceomyces palustris TaxID=1673888 RepID=A0ACD0P030_9BASI|nr:hypothetical protein IE53DRAFT_386254 [Violaceomyces palustris]
MKTALQNTSRSKPSKGSSLAKRLFQVRVKPSTFSDDQRWSNKDMDPIHPSEWKWSELDFINYWATDMFALPLWSTISTVVGLGFTAREAVPITFFGFLLCACVITWTSALGSQYRISFPVAARSAFGMRGSILPILARCFVALMWLAILTFQGAGLVEQMIIAVVPGFGRMENPFPPSANITPPELISFFLYWFLQTGLSYLPIPKLRWLFTIKALIVPPTFLAMLIWASVVTKGTGGPLVRGASTASSYKHGSAFAALTALNAVCGLFSSLSVNMPDFGRYSRNDSIGWSQYLALPIFGTVGALTPIFVTSAGLELWGEVIWDFPTLLSHFDSRALKFLCGLSFLIATLGNQIAADSVPFCNDSIAVWPSRLDRFRANTFAAVFCVAVTPWNIVRSGSAFVTFLGGYGSYTSCIAAILAADFFLVKKQRLDVHQLYKDRGIYWYTAGFNWRAFLAFGCG